MFFSLQNKEARITDLKQRKSVLENAADIVSVSKGVSDIRYFLEMRKIKRIIYRIYTVSFYLQMKGVEQNVMIIFYLKIALTNFPI